MAKPTPNTTYKAILTNVSELDVAGRLRVYFDAYQDGALLYEGVEVEAPAAGLADTVKDRLASIKQAVDAAADINVGSEITL